MATRRPTATPTRVALNVWSLTGPETAHSHAIRRKTLLRQLRPKIRPTTEDAQRLPNSQSKLGPTLKGPSTPPSPFSGSGKLPGTGVKKDNSRYQLPWERNQPSRVVQEPPRESARRAPPAPPPRP
ncbi:hypothetical protein EVAR_46103_1 [Eumeta japonica]|uniref:Uncharacterized protein n=1 Tax=Eumeta variegata TaxID=151549 RepID=A0A4C1XI14_EUMVA|nr:hypothetical protein EVAR_46103_1 [Eumeta japonica]